MIQILSRGFVSLSQIIILKLLDKDIWIKLHRYYQDFLQIQDQKSEYGK
jgi:hypothetical protein